METKELIIGTQEIENLKYSPDFSKKEAVQQGRILARDIMDRGEVAPISVLSNLLRLQEVVNAAVGVIRENVTVTETTVENGIEFSSRSTGDRLDYEKDSEYKRLAELAKERAEELKIAYNKKQKGQRHYIQSFDEETGEEIAVEVPAVPLKSVGKMVVTAKF